MAGVAFARHADRLPAARLALRCRRAGCCGRFGTTTDCGGASAARRLPGRARQCAPPGRRRRRCARAQGVLVWLGGHGRVSLIWYMRHSMMLAGGVRQLTKLARGSRQGGGNRARSSDGEAAICIASQTLRRRATGQDILERQRQSAYGRGANQAHRWDRHRQQASRWRLALCLLAGGRMLRAQAIQRGLSRRQNVEGAANQCRRAGGLQQGPWQNFPFQNLCRSPAVNCLLPVPGSSLLPSV